MEAEAILAAAEGLAPVVGQVISALSSIRGDLSETDLARADAALAALQSHNDDDYIRVRAKLVAAAALG